MECVVSNGIRIKPNAIVPDSVRGYTYRDYRKDIEVTSIEFDKERNELIFPRNLQKFNNLTENKYNFKFAYITNPTNIELRENYKMYEHQTKAVAEVMQYLMTDQASCILKAPTSFGKTYILPYIVKQVKQKTLILVDRTNLAEQMFESFEENVVKGGVQILNRDTQDLCEVNISTLQLLAKNPNLIKKLKKEIGFVIVDELHLVSTGTLTKVITSLPAKYRLGLSATPTRSDGLTQIIFDHFSNNMVNGENPLNLPVTHIVIEHIEEINYMGKLDANEAWRELYLRPNLVLQVIKLIEKILETKPNRAIFIYTTMQDVQKLITKLLKEKGYKAEFINSKVKAKDRKKYIEQFNNREIDFLVSGVILQKGISIHRMDTIINYSNHTKESFEQVAGRLRRLHNEKNDPVLVHFCFKGKGLYKCKNTFGFLQNLTTNYKDTIKKWNYQFFNKFINS